MTRTHTDTDTDADARPDRETRTDGDARTATDARRTDARPPGPRPIDARTSDGPPGDDGVLASDDLALDDPRARALGDGRFLIRPERDGEPAAPAPVPDSVPTTSRLSLADVPERYAVDVAVKTDRGVADERFRANDVRAIFADLLRWYVERLAPEDDPAEVLDLLLETTDIRE
ncbi:DUF7500 family protein [Halomarina pelagica]|uniref:DUF7500 family protein n=1 Tax=Halomarina pelagica TaxID=2961599 RepID=UPI0020C41F64|nr:hypothetical protein [Halomarina sp. BND7]